MSEEKQSRIGRILSRIGNGFRRRRTPSPQMPLWTTGIREPVLVQGITIPALYSVANENLILRTVLSTLQQKYSVEVIIGKRSFTRSAMIVVRNINTM